MALVHFDRSGSSANLFDSATLRELQSVAGQLTGVRAVIFVSDKPSVFIAGADLKELSSVEEPEQLIELGQQTFNKVALLRCITVAAIHGACAGGGVEFALACDHRVATNDRVTKIGLPEVQLGLIPGWGGSTRLPRLIGIRRALNVILKGDLMPAGKAHKLGIVDALVPKERLLEAARRIVVRGKRSLPKIGLLTALAEAPIARKLAERTVREKTHGHYPAPLAAIDVVTHALRRSVAESLEAEKTAIVALAKGEVCRNLIRVFFLQERAKRQSAPAARDVEQTAVIGAGVMGSGIAQWLAARGCRVILRDVSTDQLANGLKQAASLFADASKRRLMTRAEAQAGMDRIVPAEIDISLEHVDLVVEAAVERMPLKKEIFRKLEKLTRPETILATNTSALSISELAAELSHPRRVVGLHFFNPVHRMKLVEVVRGDVTSAEALDTAVALVQKIGKFPVVVKDRPGFLVNRILMPYLVEAVLLFEKGASRDEIDEAMLDFGMPMGPLRLLDEVGLDVAADVAKTLSAAFPGRMPMPILFEQMLAAGSKGKKSGKGFYDYRTKEHSHPAPVNHGLQDKMVLLMINEGARCLEEKIVSDPRDVDFAMILGTGFAPFRGGPLRYADSIGIGKVTEDLQRLAESRDPRFTPCDLLKEMSSSNRQFYPEN